MSSRLYRNILRELRKSAVAAGKQNKDVVGHFRSMVGKSGDAQSVRDLGNAALFLRSQREHKALLHRYNPLLNYTSEERIKATANRVGLQMPLTPKPE
ncbi:hypothetical protein AX15_005889 [Amanita polypyramis BW_CC]|nr:hypothetical protein AX15_005889 [Amanita polypyramis BW_CC]